MRTTDGLRGAQHPRRVALCHSSRPDAEHARDTLTVRNNPSQEALPMRRLGSFLPGEVVAARACTGVATPGAGPTWSSRCAPCTRSVTARASSGRHDDPGLGHHLRRARALLRQFEHTAAISGKAGNLKGQIQAGGNHSGSAARREYPLPPLTPILCSEMFDKAARDLGYHPFPRPTSTLRAPTPIRTGRSSAPVSIAAIVSASAAKNAKGSAHITVIPIAMRNPNFTLRTPFMGHQGAQGLRWQEGHRRHLHQHPHRRGVRAAGRNGSAVRLCDQQRAPDAALRHRRAI